MDYVFNVASSEHYDYSTPLFGVDYYRPDSQGEDDFSRRLVWFYNYGDEDIKEDLKSRLAKILQERFVEDEEDWDLVTLYPVHEEGLVNENLEELVKEVCEETGFKFERVMERTRTVKESHDLDSFQEKVVNLEGSVEVENVEGKNIVLVDNVSLSGASILHGKQVLKENGASKVFGVCLGLKEDREMTFDPGDLKASQILEKIEN